MPGPNDFLLLQQEADYPLFRFLSSQAILARPNTMDPSCLPCGIFSRAMQKCLPFLSWDMAMPAATRSARDCRANRIALTQCHSSAIYALHFSCIHATSLFLIASPSKQTPASFGDLFKHLNLLQASFASFLQLFSLKEQVTHKATYVREHMLGRDRPPVVLIGHSIGDPFDDRNSEIKRGLLTAYHNPTILL